MKNQALLKLAKEKLTQTEYAIFTAMNAQYLVPFSKGAPGIGKTFLYESISEKLGMVYIDLRTTTMDETDAGLYPFPIKNDKTGITSLSHLPPHWAVMPVENPDKNYLIVFEEINRASSPIRNACMGVLLERRVGFNIKFGNNVFMAATGNLGQADGTEVEELDFAQRDRFIVFEHKHDLHTWIKDYAQGVIHPDIIKFLESKPTKFYPDLKDQVDHAPITPRKWSGFSNYLVSNTDKGLASTIDDYGHLLDMVGHNYLGNIAVEFKRFTMEGRMLTLADVLSGKRAKDYPRIPRENRAEVINELKAETQNPLEYTATQVKHLKDFLIFMREADHDILTGYLYDAGHLASAKINERENEKKVTLSKTDILKIPFMNMLFGKEKDAKGKEIPGPFAKELEYVYTKRANKTEEAAK